MTEELLNLIAKSRKPITVILSDDDLTEWKTESDKFFKNTAVEFTQGAMAAKFPTDATQISYGGNTATIISEKSFLNLIK